jgi:hypothetical protein
MNARRRGRSILLWFAAVFFAAQIAGGLVLDYCWTHARYPFKWQMYANLEARARTPDIIFLGSSRFAGGINCPVLDAELRRGLGPQAPRTFNAALPAGEPAVFERVVDDFARRGHHPRMLVLEISPETVTHRDLWLSDAALNVLDWRDVPEAVPALCRNHRIMALVRGRLLPLYLHRHHIRKQALALLDSWRHPLPAAAKSDPPVPRPVTCDPEPPILTAKIKGFMEAGYELVCKDMRDFRAGGGMCGHRLERLLARCQATGVHVLLVAPPVSSPYRRGYSKEVNAAFLAYVQELCARYGCRYIDWRDRLPDPYFCDCHHQYPAGSVYFCRHLGNEVLVPLWRDFQHYQPNYSPEY